MKQNIFNNWVGAIFVLVVFTTVEAEKPEQQEEESRALTLEEFTDHVFDAYKAKKYTKVLDLLKEKRGEEWNKVRAFSYQNRGIAHFYEGRIKESITDFDSFLEIYPEEDPRHWQRGLSYYYAERYQEGKAQFERHQTVNSQDVENAVWHFLCAVRTPGGSFQAASEKLIPIQKDTRVPMKEVHELFAGSGSVEKVIQVAEATEGDESRKRNHLCYAHLYVALYFEAKGEDEKMKKHIALAAGKYSMDHYMGKVAQVHAKLRGVTIPE